MKLLEALSTDFYDRPPAIVARELLGKHLVRRTRAGLCSGRIVETEAYLGEADEASHAFRGQTARNGSMFGRPGLAYVYRIHQVYCVNAVTEIGSAVLIRAIEPIDGIPLMQQRTGKRLVHHTARGPGLLCRALDIDRSLDGWDLTRGRTLWIADGNETENLMVCESTRIGISRAKELLLRFYLDECRYVSRLTRVVRGPK